MVFVTWVHFMFKRACNSLKLMKKRNLEHTSHKIYSICYSQVVTHPSTNEACVCLTSVITWELVYSARYGHRLLGLFLVPYTIMHGHLLLAISDTSHWTSFVQFGLKTAWDISYHILWLILKYVNFWLLQDHLSTFGKIEWLQKINFFSMKEQ